MRDDLFVESSLDDFAKNWKASDDNNHNSNDKRNAVSDRCEEPQPLTDNDNEQDNAEYYP